MRFSIAKNKQVIREIKKGPRFVPGSFFVSLVLAYASLKIYLAFTRISNKQMLKMIMIMGFYFNVIYYPFDVKS